MEQGQAVFLSCFVFAGIKPDWKVSKETMEFMESEYGSVVFFTETVRQQYMARKTNFKILS